MAKKTGAVTLRGRFAPGEKVELVAGEFPDALIPDAIKSATVRPDGSVSFDGLDPGRVYAVRDKDRTRQAQVTARSDRPIESSLIGRPDLTPLDEPNETPVEPVPRVLHTGPRGTRQLSSTRGDTFAGEVGEPGRLTKPQKVADHRELRQADFAGPQASDTPIGQATPVTREKVDVERRHTDHPDPVSEARAAKPGDNVVKGTESRPATPEEVEKAVKPPARRKSSKASARKRPAKKSSPRKRSAPKRSTARKRTSKRS